MVAAAIFRKPKLRMKQSVFIKLEKLDEPVNLERLERVE
jgi:hypothetical protein